MQNSLFQVEMEAVEEPEASNEGEEEGGEDKDPEETELEGEVTIWGVGGDIKQ